jgi:two-component system sensor histidine kinase UhpB
MTTLPLRLAQASDDIDPDAHDVPFHQIVEQSVAGIYVIQDECFVYANRTWADMIGHPLDAVVGSHLSNFVPDYFLPEVMRLYYKRLLAPPGIRFVTRVLHRDGHELRVEVHGCRIHFRGRPAVMGVGVDITERLKTEEELQRSREQLRALGTYARRKLEEQRLGLARDVHDVLGGLLTAISMDAARLLKGAAGAQVRDTARELVELTQRAMEAVRNIAESLRPGELDRLGLAEVVARELAEFSERSGVKHVFDSADAGRRLPPARELAVYRIFHEAMTNIARHARASEVAVAIAWDEAALTMTVADDGVGFDATKPGRSALGLLSMSERAAEIGAQWTIDSRPGAGTRIRLSVPTGGGDQ